MPRARVRAPPSPHRAERGGEEQHEEEEEVIRPLGGLKYENANMHAAPPNTKPIGTAVSGAMPAVPEAPPDASFSIKPSRREKIASTA